MARHNTLASVLGPVKRPRVKGHIYSVAGKSTTVPHPSVGLPRPPVGTYDPSIDASERAAQRGYRDLKTDTATAGTRAASDYGIGLEDIGRTRDYGLADILRGRTRLGEDVAIEGAKIGQDYNRASADNRLQLTNLLRGYDQLGERQAQSAEAVGASGGAFQQALQKRTENLALDRAPLDTAYTRLGENREQAVRALDLARTRGVEDFGTQRERLTTQYGTGESTYKGGNPWADAWLKLNPGKQVPGTTDYGLAGQRLSLDYQRGSADRATQLRRGGRELNAYQQDLIPVRYYGAAGLTPYSPPKRRRTVRR